MSSFSSPSSQASELQVKEIPGGYGLPFFGCIMDRLDYFYFQGIDEFFKSRMLKHNSTIFRANMPPGPFISPNSKVVVLLDATSFPILFDTSKVEKKDVLYGTYMPSTTFTGGYRVCAYLDPSEPLHGTLKTFFVSSIAARKDNFIPLFRSYLSELFNNIEDEFFKNGKANFNTLSDQMSFSFIFELFSNTKASKTKLGSNGSTLMDKWLFGLLVPLVTLGLPKIFNFVEDLIIHTFPMPFFLVKSSYKKLYDAFYTHAIDILNEAEKLGIDRDEACHNLLFLAGFNAYGGMKVLFPALLKLVGQAGNSLHRQLVQEIRTIVNEEGGITFHTLDKMSLTKSVVYEALRIEPPVPFQYGKAKEDMVVSSHNVAFKIKKGEMIFGYQPFATKDPMVFESPEKFVGHRFIGDQGERLLKYLYWSNGREIGDHPSADNKQCPGKDLVVLMSRLMLVEFFLHYDTYEVEVGALPIGSLLSFKSLTRARAFN